MTALPEKDKKAEWTKPGNTPGVKMENCPGLIKKSGCHVQDTRRKFAWLSEEGGHERPASGTGAGLGVGGRRAPGSRGRSRAGGVQRPGGLPHSAPEDRPGLYPPRGGLQAGHAECAGVGRVLRGGMGGHPPGRRAGDAGV